MNFALNVLSKLPTKYAKAALKKRKPFSRGGDWFSSKGVP